MNEEATQPAEDSPERSPDLPPPRNKPSGVRGVLREVKESLFRHDFYDAVKTRCEIMYTYFILHIMPVKMNRRTLKVTATWGLGIITLALFLILGVTGVLLMFHYVPSATVTASGLPEAYERMLNLRSNVGYGPFVRNMHRWAAHGMIVAALLHMARVFLMGSYKKPRQFNWVIGVFLLGLTLFASYTGYLLPWDQLAFWGVRVGTEIARYAPGGGLIRSVLLGDADVGQEALLRFYVLHCMVLPGAITALVVLHFWRVRKDGGLACPAEPLPPASPDEAVPASNKTGSAKTFQLLEVMRGRRPQTGAPVDRLVYTWPAGIIRILIAMLLTLLLMSVLSIVFNAPLEEPANPAAPPNPAKAPWYFLGLQELVSYDAFVGGVAIPGAAFVLLLMVPYLDRSTARVGVWFARERWVLNTAFLLSLLVAAGLIIIGVYFRGANWAFVLPWQQTGGH